MVCGMKRGIFEGNHAVSRFLAKDRHQQSTTGGFEREGPNEADSLGQGILSSNQGTVLLPCQYVWYALHFASSKSRRGHSVVSYLEDYPLSWNHLLEVLPDGIAFVDEQGTIRHANERLTVLTGYTRDELVGQAVEMLVPSPERDAHVAHRDEYSRDPKAREMGSGLD